MPNKKLEIMEIRRILRLYHSGKSKRFIANYLGLSRNTVNKYLVEETEALTPRASYIVFDLHSLITDT